MFAYCGNNPVNRIDPTGMFWNSIKKIVSKAWNNVKTWAKNTFGAGATSSHQTKQETELLPVILNLAVTIKTGTKENKTFSQIGDSSKPLSVYANGRTDNFMASSVGAKVNISNVSIDASLGLEDIGISIVKKSGDFEKAYGITMDATQFKVGFEWSTSTIVQWDNNTTLTNYTNVSITAAGVLALYAVMTGQLQNLKQLQTTN